MCSRRRFITGLWTVAGVTLLGSTFRGHADATLDADVSVTDWRITDAGVTDLWFELDSWSDQPITPRCLCWGSSHAAQQPWTIVGDSQSVPPGGERIYHITPLQPSDDTYLNPGERAVLLVFDRGRDARASDIFQPTEVLPEHFASR